MISMTCVTWWKLYNLCKISITDLDIQYLFALTSTHSPHLQSVMQGPRNLQILFSKLLCLLASVRAAIGDTELRGGGTRSPKQGKRRVLTTGPTRQFLAKLLLLLEIFVEHFILWNNYWNRTSFLKANTCSSVYTF